MLFIAFGLLAVVPILASLGGNTATLLKGGVPAGLPPAHLVGALGAGLLGTGYGTRYVELVRDYARCSSAERAYIASTSLKEANHVLFMVDDLEDRHLRDGFNRVPPSRDARCACELPACFSCDPSLLRQLMK